jgi:hypothetical protein
LTPETKIKKDCHKVLDQLHIFHRHLFQDKYTRSTKGVSDDFIINQGVIFVEYKVPGKQLRPEQEEFRQLCERNTVKYWVITSVEDLINHIQGVR